MKCLMKYQRVKPLAVKCRQARASWVPGRGWSPVRPSETGRPDNATISIKSPLAPGLAAS